MYVENVNLNISTNPTDFKLHLHQLWFLVLMGFPCLGQASAGKSGVVMSEDDRLLRILKISKIYSEFQV